jgi:endonuclease IV
MDFDNLNLDPQVFQLISFYKQKLDSSFQEYSQALDLIDQIKIKHEESHSLSWEVLKRTKEINQLQQALSDFQAAVAEERKLILKVVAENDQLKSNFYSFKPLVQELKDRKKIRFLLSIAQSGRGNEDQVMYFKERLDKRLVKIGRVKGPRDLVTTLT